MKSTGPSSSFVHLQESKVLIVKIKCVSVNIHSEYLKSSVHDTNFMESIMAYIKRVYIMQGLLYGCFKST